MRVLGNWTQVLCRSSQCSQPPSPLSSPSLWPCLLIFNITNPLLGLGPPSFGISLSPITSLPGLSSSACLVALPLCSVFLGSSSEGSKCSSQFGVYAELIPERPCETQGYLAALQTHLLPPAVLHAAAATLLLVPALFLNTVLYFCFKQPP